MSSIIILCFLQVYRFLGTEVGIYLPPIETVTVWHLRDLAANNRKMIKCEQVKVIQVPQYDGLTFNDILAYVQRTKNGDVMAYLPLTEKEIYKLPRAYLSNVAYTVIGNDFKTWMKVVMNQRNARVTDDKDMAIRMDPEIAQIFKSSTSVSGKSFVLVGSKKIYLKALGL